MKKSVSLFVIVTLLFSLLPPNVFAAASSTNAAFTDITKHWARDSINLGAKLGLVNGTGDNKYSPNAAVTREAFIALIVRAAGEEKTSGIPLPSYSPFSDVSSDRWSSTDIKTAATLGWIVQADYPDYMFKPSQNLTREEAASFLRALLFGQAEDMTGIVTTVTFKDEAKISAKNKQDVILLSNLGIIQGNEGKFNPKDTLTRAESITLILRALSYQSNILSYIANLDGNHNTAMGYATSAFLLSPNPDSTVQLASAHLGNSDYETAEKLYVAALKEGYANPYILSNAALSAYYQDDFKGAAEYQRELVEQVPTDALQVFLLAQYEGMDGNYNEAVRLANEAKTLDTEGHYRTDIEEFLQFIKKITSSKSELAKKEVQVLFWKKISDFIDKHSDAIQLVAMAVAFVPVVGQVTAVALNTVVIGNTVARAIADPSQDNILGVAQDVLGAAAGPALKYGGKLVSKGIGNAVTSKTITNRVMNEVIKDGAWDELTKLQKYEDSLNSYLKTGVDIRKNIKKTETTITYLEGIDHAAGAGGNLYDFWKKDGKDELKKVEEAPEIVSNAFTPWIGEWNFDEKNLGTGTIEITNVTKTTMDFEHSTVSSKDYHTGNIKGTATIKGNTATLNTGEKDTWTSNTCTVTFTATAEKLVVKASYCGYYHGFNGFIGGTFYK